MLYKKFKVAKIECPCSNYSLLIEFVAKNLISEQVPRIKYKRCNFEEAMKLVFEQSHKKEKYCILGFGDGEYLLQMHMPFIHYLYVSEEKIDIYQYLNVHKKEKPKKPESFLKRFFRRLLNIIMWN